MWQLESFNTCGDHQHYKTSPSVPTSTAWFGCVLRTSVTRSRRVFNLFESHWTFLFGGSSNICGVISLSHTVFSHTPAVATNCFDLQLFCERVTFPIYQRSKPLKPGRHLLPEYQNLVRSRTEHEDEVTFQQVIWTAMILKAGLWELLVEILAAVPLCL